MICIDYENTDIMTINMKNNDPKIGVENKNQWAGYLQMEYLKLDKKSSEIIHMSTSFWMNKIVFSLIFTFVLAGVIFSTLYYGFINWYFNVIFLTILFVILIYSIGKQEWLIIDSCNKMITGMHRWLWIKKTFRIPFNKVTDLIYYFNHDTGGDVGTPQMGYLFITPVIQITITLVPNKDQYLEELGREIASRIGIKKFRVIKSVNLNLKNLALTFKSPDSANIERLLNNQGYLKHRKVIDYKEIQINDKQE